MAGFKETPRQKMIGMMYLVLTALLALNVSVEILNAFLVVNESIETTNSNFSNKIDKQYTSFEKQYNESPDKTGPYWEKAKQARALSQDIKNYITNVKYEAIAKSEKIPIDSAKIRPLVKIASKDKYDETTTYFIGNSQDGSAGKAGELRKKIDKYRQDLLNLVDPAKRNMINIGLKTDGDYADADGAKQNWEMHNFYHTILAADVTILNKLINEVQSAETDVVAHLFNEISASDFKIDKIEARVIPKSQYVFMGESFEAEVYVTAMDSKQNFTVTSNAGSTTSVNGVAKFSTYANAQGQRQFSGNVLLKTPSGETQSLPFSCDYIVAPPTLSVSATKMNVFYVGVDNPVSISAGGVSDAQISASIDNGSMVRSGGGWVVRPGSSGKAYVSVNANLGGKVKNMGRVEYRVKNVPSPTAFIANTDGGNVSKEMLQAAGAIIPRMPADFEFDLNFVVVSFKMSGNKRGGDVQEYPGNGNRLTQSMRDFISTARTRDKIMFEDILARGPDGKTRKLNSIVITLQ